MCLYNSQLSGHSYRSKELELERVHSNHLIKHTIEVETSTKEIKIANDENNKSNKNVDEVLNSENYVEEEYDDLYFDSNSANGTSTDYEECEHEGIKIKFFTRIKIIKSPPNRCLCGEKVLKKVANQLKVQAATLKLTPRIFPSGVKFEDRVVEVLSSTMSVFQTEMAKLMEVYIDDSPSTSCACINQDKHKTEIKESKSVTVATTHRDQFTEIDRFDILRNIPGDHVSNYRSISIPCECHPTHLGAAPPTIAAQTSVSCLTDISRVDAYTATSRTSARDPVIWSSIMHNDQKFEDTLQSFSKLNVTGKASYCIRMLSHSKIPTLSGSPRLPLIQKKRLAINSKIGYDDKTAGVQTELSLENHLQSESFSYLQVFPKKIQMLWDSIRLEPPKSYIFKVGKYIVNYKSNNQVQSIDESHSQTKTSVTQVCRTPSNYSCTSKEVKVEISWEDILIPKSYNKIFNSMLQIKKVSKAIESPHEDTDISEKLSTSSFAIKSKLSITELNLTKKYSSTTSVMSSLISLSTINIKDDAKIIAAQVNVSPTKENLDNISVLLDEDNVISNINYKQLPVEPQTPEATNPPLEANHEEAVSNEPENTADEDETKPPTDANEDDDDKREDDDNKREDDDDKSKIDVKPTEMKFSPGRCSCMDKIKPITFKSDAVMRAMETCEIELKPLRTALTELQSKVRSLNMPELKGCLCTITLEESQVFSKVSTQENVLDTTPVVQISPPPHRNMPCIFYKPPKLESNHLINFSHGRLPRSSPPFSMYAPSNHLHHFNNKKQSSCSNKESKCACRKSDGTRKIENVENLINKKPRSLQKNQCTHKKNKHRCTDANDYSTNKSFSSRKEPDKSSKRTPKVKIHSIKSIIHKYKTTSCVDLSDDEFSDILNNNRPGNQESSCVQNYLMKYHKNQKREPDCDSVERVKTYKNVLNLRPRQAVRTHPNDFLLPKHFSNMSALEASCLSSWSSIPSELKF
ncbi:hypothetical protein FQA39_LY01543 [Lamprigera yunnana]|nr:hypothetical protein FQA39_LY01543 [Lamprigera yunnana]